MSEPTVGGVRNTVDNQGQILNMLQIGHMHGHVSIYFGDLWRTETDELLAEYQSYLVATFHAADLAGYRSFQARFRDERWGILVGEPGSGRETTAISLHDERGLKVHSVSVRADAAQSATRDERPDLRLDRLFPVPKNGYLVDLSAISNPDERLVGAVRSLKQRVLAVDGSAVLFISRSGPLEVELAGAPVLRVRRPPGADVLSRHLEHLVGEGTRDLVLGAEGIRELLDEAAPADAARFARIAYGVHQTRRGEEIHLNTWVSQALDAYRDWRGELDEWFERHSGVEAAWNRVVLIATAFLEGLETLTVLSAADELAEQLSIPPGDAGGLLGLGTDPTLEAISARRGPDDRVSFVRPEYAYAVIEYVWEQFPRLRDALIRWSGDLSAQDDRLLKAVCQAWVRLTLLRRDLGLSTRLFEKWAEGEKTGRIAEEFAAEVAASPDLGRGLRGLLYGLAKRTTSDRRTLIAARVCARYGRTDPVSALYRLKWLAGSSDEKVRRAVASALEQMSAHGEVWGELVRAVVDEWCHEGVPVERRRVAARFLVDALRREGEGMPRLVERVRQNEGAWGGTTSRTVSRMWRAVLDQCADLLEMDGNGRRVTDAAVHAIGPWIVYAASDADGFTLVSKILSGAAVEEGRTVPLDARSNRRMVTLGRLVLRWHEIERRDDLLPVVHSLLARFYVAGDPPEPVGADRAEVPLTLKAGPEQR